MINFSLKSPNFQQSKQKIDDNIQIISRLIHIKMENTPLSNQTGTIPKRKHKKSNKNKKSTEMADSKSESDHSIYCNSIDDSITSTGHIPSTDDNIGESWREVYTPVPPDSDIDNANDKAVITALKQNDVPEQVISLKKINLPSDANYDMTDADPADAIHTDPINATASIVSPDSLLAKLTPSKHAASPSGEPLDDSAKRVKLSPIASTDEEAPSTKLLTPVIESGSNSLRSVPSMYKHTDSYDEATNTNVTITVKSSTKTSYLSTLLFTLSLLLFKLIPQLVVKSITWVIFLPYRLTLIYLSFLFQLLVSVIVAVLNMTPGGNTIAHGLNGHTTD